MAVEWVGLGVAVAKVLLRATDHGPVADWVGDGSDLVLKLRGLRGHPKDVGGKIARTLQHELTPDLSHDDEKEVAGAALEVTALLTRLAKSDKALLHAATRPDSFLTYAKDHGGDKARRQVGARAEPAFDRILRAACEQLVTLAPWWPGFDRAAVTEILDQLNHLVDLTRQTVDNSREAADTSRLVLDHLQGNGAPDVVMASQAATRRGVKLGNPVRDWAAADLRIHDSIQVGDAIGLTPYISRQHDLRLRHALTDLAGPRMITVVGTSCTGKTRACLEALRNTLADWALVKPLDVDHLTRLLHAGIPTRTVVWLDELQNFLTTGGVEAARAIRHLLADPRNPPPMLFLGTIWPDNLNTLEARPTADQAATGRGDVRALLTETKADRIQVPKAFTADELQAASDDPRLRAAILNAVDGQVTQVLAGGTQLVDRVYGPAENSGGYSAAARAVLLATADLRRVGHPHPVPGWAIAGAAPGYLVPEERRYLSSPNWAEGILKQLAGEAGTHHAGLRDLHQTGVPPLRPAFEPGFYELHDYLLQHHLRVHRYDPTSEELWRTLTTTTRRAQLERENAVSLAENARLRGLKQEALELLEGAASSTQDAVSLSAYLLGERGDEDALAKLRARARKGDKFARLWLVESLAKRGDEEALVELRAWAGTDDFDARRLLAELLARRGDEVALAELRVWAGAERSALLELNSVLAQRGDEGAQTVRHAWDFLGNRFTHLQPANLLVEMEDQEVLASLRSRADVAGEWHAQSLLSDFLVERGDEEALVELRARANSPIDDFHALSRLLDLLVERGDEEALAELRDLSRYSWHAQSRLVDLLFERRDEDALAELRARADAGEEIAGSRLIDLLVERGDEEALAELRRAVHVCRPRAADALIRYYSHNQQSNRALQLDVCANPRPWGAVARTS